MFDFLDKDVFERRKYSPGFDTLRLVRNHLSACLCTSASVCLSVDCLSVWKESMPCLCMSDPSYMILSLAAVSRAL